LNFQDILEQIPPSSTFQSEKLVSMEVLDMNEGSGMSYGYIIYETTLEFTEFTSTLTVNKYFEFYASE